MTLLLHGDCLEHMKDIDTDSVDLIFCDLPYGQTNCKWDIIIPWEEFWNEIMRIKKINTPIFFTTTTKFGVEIINNAPKQCPFRYDLIWIKSASAGFLSSKKMPLRKHELIYVFYEKLPFYDLSSHKHKFIDKDDSVKAKDGAYGSLQIKPPKTSGARWEPALPTSIIKGVNNTYNTEGRKKPIIRQSDKQQYDPPLPNSVIRPTETYQNNSSLYGKIDRPDFKRKDGESMYDPPLPNSLLEIKSTRGSHSTEKPIALIEWILKYYSKEGDVVLDPTMGSGSCGVACKNMNRNFIGIEKDNEIYQVAVNRIEI